MLNNDPMTKVYMAIILGTDLCTFVYHLHFCNLGGNWNVRYIPATPESTERKDRRKWL